MALLRQTVQGREVGYVVEQPMGMLGRGEVNELRKEGVAG